MRIIIGSYGVVKDGGRAGNGDTSLSGKQGANSKSRDAYLLAL